MTHFADDPYVQPLDVATGADYRQLEQELLATNSRVDRDRLQINERVDRLVDAIASLSQSNTDQFVSIADLFEKMQMEHNRQLTELQQQLGQLQTRQNELEHRFDMLAPVLDGHQKALQKMSEALELTVDHAEYHRLIDHVNDLARFVRATLSEFGLNSDHLENLLLVHDEILSELAEAKDPDAEKRAARMENLHRMFEWIDQAQVAGRYPPDAWAEWQAKGGNVGDPAAAQPETEQAEGTIQVGETQEMSLNIPGLGPLKVLIHFTDETAAEQKEGPITHDPNLQYNN